MGEDNAKLSSSTTTKEHFKFYKENNGRASMIAPYPELAGREDARGVWIQQMINVNRLSFLNFFFLGEVIYPNERRVLGTTNERMFLKNYGNFQAKPILNNQFENNFQINKGNYAINDVERVNF